MELNKIVHADCLDYLKSLPDGCVSLALLDPPYNINHNKDWDKWKVQNEYIEWLGSVFLDCQRVLKDNGSFYFWHNDFQQMAQLQQWISQNTKFVFNSMISWVKPNFRNLAWKNKQETGNLRSWFNIQEYCLYYTFEDKGTGLGKIVTKAVEHIKLYMIDELQKSNFTKTQLNNIWWKNGWTGTEKSKKASNIMTHFFGNNEQNILPTEIQYKRMQDVTGFFQKPYEELRAEYEGLRAEYEGLRAEYEELRPTFNIQNGEDYNNTWYSQTYDTFGKNKLHTCEKPQDLLQKIILTSTNENDIVLDCFAGSGSTAVACIQTNRRFLSCEKDYEYWKIASERVASYDVNIQQKVDKEDNQPTLF